MSKHLVSHKACHDGLAGAWVVKKYDPSINVFFSSRRHEWKDNLNLNSGDILYFVDFSPHPEDLVELINKGVECLVLDHHQTDLSKMTNYDSAHSTDLLSLCRFNMEKAGCLVAWDYFFPGKPYPIMLEYIAIADTWQWRDNRDHAVVQYIRTLLEPDASIEEFDNLIRSFDEKKFIELGEVVHQRVMKEAAHMAKKFCLMNFDGTEVAAVNATLYHSEVGHELSLKSPSGIGIVFSVIPESDIIKFSARGNKANKLAERYGGGGHPQAAGFDMPIEQFNKYLITARNNAIMEALH